MPVSSDSDLLVLLGVRLRSFGSAEAVAEAARPGGRATSASGSAGSSRPGWSAIAIGPSPAGMLTADGRAEGERRLAAELDDVGARAAVAGAYARFLAVNQPCSTPAPAGSCAPSTAAPWSTTTPTPATTPRCWPGSSPSTTRCSRWWPTWPRRSLASVATAPGCPAPWPRCRAATLDWFTKPTIDSYHSVWFELHENLLATLGIERATEPVATEP